MTVPSHFFLVAGRAAVGGATGDSVDQLRPTETTADLNTASHVPPGATTPGANTSQFRPAPTSAGRNLTAQPKPVACDFQLILGICDANGRSL